jgi:hypothetical protein
MKKSSLSVMSVSCKNALLLNHWKGLIDKRSSDPYKG